MSKTRILEVIIGLAVLVILVAVILIVLKDNRQIRQDRMWMDRKFDELLEANDALLRRMFTNGNKLAVKPGAFLDEQDFSVAVTRGHFVKAEDDASCDSFVVPEPRGELVTFMNRKPGDALIFSADSAGFTEESRDLLLGSSSGKQLDVVIAYKVPTEGEPCGVSFDVLRAVASPAS